MINITIKNSIQYFIRISTVSKKYQEINNIGNVKILKLYEFILKQKLNCQYFVFYFLFKMVLLSTLHTLHFFFFVAFLNIKTNKEQKKNVFMIKIFI